MGKQIKVVLELTSVINSEVEDVFDAPDDWDSMTSQEQSDYLDECVQVHIGNHVDAWSDVLDDSDDDDIPGE